MIDGRGGREVLARVIGRRLKATAFSGKERPCIVQKRSNSSDVFTGP